jgi:hypothetical protein
MSIFFNTATGNRLIDNVNIVPEFIGKVTLSNSPSVGGVGSESGYRLHRYAGRMPATNGRPYMVFWSIPASLSDVWWLPVDVVGFSGSAQVSAVIDAFFAPGTPMPAVLPEAYVFSLGPVEISPLKMAARVWDNAGRLLFDSGKMHLALQHAVGGMSVDFSTSVLALPSLSSKAAFLVPSVFHRREVYTQGDQEAIVTDWYACVRFTGGEMIARLVQVYRTGVTPSQEWSYQQDHTYGNTTGLVLPVIDASIYD